MQPFVPVRSASDKRLMPTTNRADRLIAKGRAIRRFDRGLFYIQLTDRTDGYTQPIAVGIDPGSKKEGYTVQSEQHTFLNVQADALTWVSEAVETRLETLRRSGATVRHPAAPAVRIGCKATNVSRHPRVPDGAGKCA